MTCASAVPGTVTVAPVSRVRASRTRIRRSWRSSPIRAPASKVTPASGSWPVQDPVRPGALLVGQGAPRLSQGLGEERAPPGDIVQRHSDGMLDEPGHTRRRPGRDEHPHPIELSLVEGHRRLLGRHTTYHTSDEPPTRPYARASTSARNWPV